MEASDTQEIYDIYFDTDHQWVIMRWDGYVSTHQFREGTEMMLNLLIENRASKVLADIKHMLLIDKEDQVWLEQFFLPRAIRFGFRAIAIVKPDSHFNRAAMERISMAINQTNFEIQLFDTIEEAEQWLKLQ